MFASGYIYNQLANWFGRVDASDDAKYAQAKKAYFQRLQNQMKLHGGESSSEAEGAKRILTN